MRPTPRRPPTLRVRTGCLTCRARKKKCDEAVPVCSGCRRNELRCEYPKGDKAGVKQRHRRGNSESASLSSRPVHDDAPRLETRSDGERSGDSASSDIHVGTDDLSVADDDGEDGAGNEGFDAGTTAFDQGCERQGESDLWEINQQVELEASAQSQARALVLSSASSCRQHGQTAVASDPLASLGLFPPADFSLDHFELVGYYISQTAVSMSNGSTSSNPFVTELIPLAMSSKLILHLLIAQSASHRAITEPTAMQVVAVERYVRSLEMFRLAIDHGADDASRSIILSMAALILCFTETARGDAHGAVFDHLIAADSLILSGLSSASSGATTGLRNFMLEYYIYATTTSMISVDVRFGEPRVLKPELVTLAEELVSNGYSGHLCGCWLQLLLLIPQIYEIGRRASSVRSNEDYIFPTADDLVDVSMLYSQILSYSPPPTAGDDVAAAGLLYQQALIIYLWTTVDALSTRRDGVYRSLIDGAVAAAVLFLEQIPINSKVHAGLCWPIAVLGSMAYDEHIRATIYSRLEVMSQTIRLGNIGQTLSLLTNIWNDDTVHCTPWTLAQHMEHQGTWISFA